MAPTFCLSVSLYNSVIWMLRLIRNILFTLTPSGSRYHCVYAKENVDCLMYTRIIHAKENVDCSMYTRIIQTQSLTVQCTPELYRLKRRLNLAVAQVASAIIAFLICSIKT